MASVPLTLAAIGCGSRVQVYTKYAAALPDRYRVVAAADPNPVRLQLMRDLLPGVSLRTFRNDRELFAAGKLADVLMIGTQDAYHVQPCIAAMELGYDVLLEKPIATDYREVLELESAARRLGRRVLVCHVLRYTPFYTRVKSLLETGLIGEIATVTATEGVAPFHQAHSFVRGHWSVVAQSSPMIIAKCCHDLDILSWLVGAKCEQVSSFGSLAFFNAAHAPAGAPARCTDGCPVAGQCDYDAHRYLGDQRGWLKWVFDGGEAAPDADVKQWLATSPWGRCVYRCDNTAVDRQTVNLRFANNVAATLTMTAFDTGRSLEIRGTRGVLLAGETVKRLCGHDMAVTYHHDGRTEYFDLTVEEGDFAGHGGGDFGLMNALDAEWRKPDSAEMRSSLQRSVESHTMGFAAEEARLTGRVVALDEFRARHS
ncbi:MAG: Gfo/Idh/MocA family protein [Opitutales bacterium]